MIAYEYIVIRIELSQFFQCNISAWAPSAPQTCVFFEQYTVLWNSVESGDGHRGRTLYLVCLAINLDSIYLKLIVSLCIDSRNIQLYLSDLAEECIYSGIKVLLAILSTDAIGYIYRLNAVSTIVG